MGAFPQGPLLRPRNRTGRQCSGAGKEARLGQVRWLPENACPLSAFSPVVGLPDGVRSAPDLHSKSFLLT